MGGVHTIIISREEDSKIILVQLGKEKGKLDPWECFAALQLCCPTYSGSMWSQMALECQTGRIKAAPRAWTAPHLTCWISRLSAVEQKQEMTRVNWTLMCAGIPQYYLTF